MRNATRVMAAAMGTLMGLAGIEHGIGEILQGNTAPSSIMFPSWPGSPFFRIVGGEPAMSIIPNLLVTGILAILSSLIFIGWATLFVQKKNGGLVLILLSVIMLLVGGGFAPPILGIIIGAVATRINAPLTWWCTYLPDGYQRFLVKSWPGSLMICLIAWLLLFPGVNILGYFFGVNDPGVTILLILFALAVLLTTITSGFVYDSCQNELVPKA
jgi:hypothetical protein